MEGIIVNVFIQDTVVRNACISLEFSSPIYGQIKLNKKPLRILNRFFVINLQCYSKHFPQPYFMSYFEIFSLAIVVHRKLLGEINCAFFWSQWENSSCLVDRVKTAVSVISITEDSQAQWETCLWGSGISIHMAPTMREGILNVCLRHKLTFLSVLWCYENYAMNCPALQTRIRDGPGWQHRAWSATAKYDAFQC